jgi:hypothetical protein
MTNKAAKPAAAYKSGEWKIFVVTFCILSVPGPECARTSHQMRVVKCAKVSGNLEPKS